MAAYLLLGTKGNAVLYTWTTDDYPEDLQYEAWTSLISSSAYELSFDKPKEARFHAAHRSFQLNSVGYKKWKRRSIQL